MTTKRKLRLIIEPCQMRIVEVEWLDAQLLNPSDGRFRDPNEFIGEKPTSVRVVGWLIDDNKDCIIIANEYSPETSEVKLVHVIPQKSVVGFKLLKEVSK